MGLLVLAQGIIGGLFLAKDSAVSCFHYTYTLIFFTFLQNYLCEIIQRLMYVNRAVLARKREEIVKKDGAQCIELEKNTLYLRE